MSKEINEKAILAEEEKSTKVKTKKVKMNKRKNAEEESPLAVPMAKRFLTFERRKAIWGYIFISPWILGVIVFFIIPMITAVAYTFSEITVNKGFQLKFVGLENYQYFFTTDTVFFKDKLIPSLLNMIWQVPIIIIFSLFVAMLIKEKFFGRTLARAIFFLPVIVSSGVVLGILKQNILGGQTTVGGMESQAAYMFTAPSFGQLFQTLGVPTQITEFINNVVGVVFDLTWKSGVQILLLLAAVNNIPASQYEVADMEGATSWEKFWKITFPMVSPTLLVTIIYSIIDTFTDFQNPVMVYMMEFTKNSKWALGTTIAVIYFIAVLLIIGLVNLFVSKHVFYYND